MSYLNQGLQMEVDIGQCSTVGDLWIRRGYNNISLTGTITTSSADANVVNVILHESLVFFPQLFFFSSFCRRSPRCSKSTSLATSLLFPPVPMQLVYTRPFLPMVNHLKLSKPLISLQ